MKFELRILPWAMVSLYTTKILILGAQYVDAPILLILAAFLAIFEYKAKDKKYIELQDKIKELENKDKDIEIKLEEVKNRISTVTVAKSFGR
jgi:Na+/melibiose symporter-like transporter